MHNLTNVKLHFQSTKVLKKSDNFVNLVGLYLQKGFESLRSLVPSLEDVSEKESKAVMLFKSKYPHRQKLGYS
jgi:predicted rRNA methylase YqxC with S4 and FtsJ domains